MNYKLTSKILATATKEDVRQLVFEYVQAQDKINALLVSLEEARHEIRILRCENEIMKKEINANI